MLTARQRSLEATSSSNASSACAPRPLIARRKPPEAWSFGGFPSVAPGSAMDDPAPTCTKILCLCAGALRSLRRLRCALPATCAGHHLGLYERPPRDQEARAQRSSLTPARLPGRRAFCCPRWRVHNRLLGRPIFPLTTAFFGVSIWLYRW